MSRELKSHPMKVGFTSESQSGSNVDSLKISVYSHTPSWTGIGLSVQIELPAILGQVGDKNPIKVVLHLLVYK
jgi:hypothetical protein